ncbi:peptidase inhibitor family I36 protein [Streptomyces iconiensis]|uniref:Peptidase inhibitor family I36 protein n=1 Tax=Streptomyces iconiensis TaxID=1384038 RepID=A0ABT6ZQ35_9ACTN|nr:peptidase inhibitor family I36 protein [Streptomyces iconiensis]MDJ1130633.1 peptidase inhibitor family I36 protein [Streptomyces iconiensis]
MAAGILAVAALAATAQPAGAEQSASGGARPRLGECGTGELCLWPRGDFRGASRAYELSGVDIESCEPLPRGGTAVSMANRTGRPVTLYQSEECAETGEFDTFPSGSWTPEVPYKARAFKVWER